MNIRPEDVERIKRDIKAHEREKKSAEWVAIMRRALAKHEALIEERKRLEAQP